MDKCTIQKIDPESPEEELQKQYDFCHSLMETETNGFYWPEDLMRTENLEEFREVLKKKKEAEDYNIDELRNRGYVPQECWWVKDENGDIIGYAKTRYLLTGFMLRHGGHIGYGLVEKYRGKGYGTKLLGLLIRECEKHDVLDILLTANSQNIGSRRVMEKNGGILWDDNGATARYWIHVEK